MPFPILSLSPLLVSRNLHFIFTHTRAISPLWSPAMVPAPCEAPDSLEAMSLSMSMCVYSVHTHFCGHECRFEVSLYVVSAQGCAYFQVHASAHICVCTRVLSAYLCI